MGCSQDTIGCRWFMEGMVSKEIIPILEDYIQMGGSLLSIVK